MTTIAKVISPILVDNVWHGAGSDVELENETAKALESQGIVDLVSIDDQTVVWGSCCIAHP